MMACETVNGNMLAEYTARNQAALDQLVNEHGVDLRQFPDEVLIRMKTISAEVLEELA